eukprot:m.167820 g.167820  ORF g.167820 m.167820 type:complete len:548 (+) comp14467_c1_seq2:1600-3243(+)
MVAKAEVHRARIMWLREQGLVNATVTTCMAHQSQDGADGHEGGQRAAVHASEATGTSDCHQDGDAWLEFQLKRVEQEIAQAAKQKVEAQRDLQSLTQQFSKNNLKNSEWQKRVEQDFSSGSVSLDMLKISYQCKAFQAELHGVKQRAEELHSDLRQEKKQATKANKTIMHLTKALARAHHVLQDSDSPTKVRVRVAAAEAIRMALGDKGVVWQDKQAAGLEQTVLEVGTPPQLHTPSKTRVNPRASSLKRSYKRQMAALTTTPTREPAQVDAAQTFSVRRTTTRSRVKTEAIQGVGLADQTSSISTPQRKRAHVTVSTPKAKGIALPPPQATLLGQSAIMQDMDTTTTTATRTVQQQPQHLAMSPSGHADRTHVMTTPSSVLRRRMAKSTISATAFASTMSTTSPTNKQQKGKGMTARRPKGVVSEAVAPRGRSKTLTSRPTGTVSQTRASRLRASSASSSSVAATLTSRSSKTTSSAASSATSSARTRSTNTRKALSTQKAKLAEIREGLTPSKTFTARLQGSTRTPLSPVNSPRRMTRLRSGTSI